MSAERGFPVLAGQTKPYAVRGSADFNARLHSALMRITDDVESVLGTSLVALVLGGGYGRGEGAVYIIDGRELPYNDLDLVPVVRGHRIRCSRDLENVAHRHESLLEVHIDFSRPFTIRGIRRWPLTMMWQDLLKGHIVLLGPDDVITANAPAYLLNSTLPLTEGLRLLLNRGLGLLWALHVVRGYEPPPDPEFVRRNYYKCALALGDAVLVANGCYTTACAGRDAMLRQLAAADPKLGLFLPLYEEALLFKFLPGTAINTVVDEGKLLSLAQRWGETLLTLESARTGRNIGSIDEYVSWPGVRERGQNRLVDWPRNILRNLQNDCFSVLYPRERLYLSLPRLLGLTTEVSENWDEDVNAFKRLWLKFN